MGKAYVHCLIMMLISIHNFRWNNRALIFLSVVCISIFLNLIIYFQLGSRYYGYRNLNAMMDVRLQVFEMHRHLFQNKDVLDIGCNVGHVTIAVARNLGARSVVGIDIDPALIGEYNIFICYGNRGPLVPNPSSVYRIYLSHSFALICGHARERRIEPYGRSVREYGLRIGMRPVSSSATWSLDHCSGTQSRRLFRHRLNPVIVGQNSTYSFQHRIRMRWATAATLVTWSLRWLSPWSSVIYLCVFTFTQLFLILLSP